MDYKEKVIALLNSQELSKEQKEKVDNQNYVKPTDKVEPKFKVGDKIYLKPEYRMPDDDTPIANTVFEIRAIDDKHYRFDGSYIFIEDQDKYELVEQRPAWSEEVERLQKRAEHNFDISLTENERQFWLGESNVLP